MTHSLADARHAIADVKRGIAITRDQLARDADVDVSPLLPLLDNLVETVADLPRAVASGLKNELIVLYSELDILGTELGKAHEALAGQLKGLSAGARAASAYNRKPDSD